MHYKDKAILSGKNGLRIYTGCTHGCIYCDSRSKYYQIQHAFDDIEVIPNAPRKLENILRKKQRCMIGTGSMSDPYIPLENNLGYIRDSLKIINRYNFGITIFTKSANILRDIDVLEEINSKTKCIVQMTLTTADDELCKKIEPNVSVSSERLKALEEFSKKGIQTVVWITPILPFINDTEENIRQLLSMCADVNVYGIISFGMGVTLREGSREYFYEQLDRWFPGLKHKYIKKYGEVYELKSDNNDRLVNILQEECQRYGIICNNSEIFENLFKYENKKFQQLDLFDL